MRKGRSHRLVVQRTELESSIVLHILKFISRDLIFGAVDSLRVGSSWMVDPTVWTLHSFTCPAVGFDPVILLGKGNINGYRCARQPIHRSIASGQYTIEYSENVLLLR